MNHVNEYKCLFDEGLTKEASEELSAFSAEALSRVTARDEEWCEAIVTKLAEEVTDVDVLDSLEHSGSPVAEGLMRKIAKFNWNAAAALATAGAAVSPLVMGMVSRAKERKAMDQNFRTVMHYNRDLQGDPNMVRYNDTIKRFSPAVAADPILLENTLKNLQAVGPAGLTVNHVKDMSGLHIDHNKYQGDLAKSTSSALSNAVDKSIGSAIHYRKVEAQKAQAEKNQRD